MKERSEESESAMERIRKRVEGNFRRESRLSEEREKRVGKNKKLMELREGAQEWLERLHKEGKQSREGE